jgi:hypothetical protein
MKLLLHARASAETTSTDTSQTHALACSRPNRRTLGPEQRRGVRGSVRRCDQTSEHGRDRNVPDERTIPLASASLSGRSPKPPMRMTRSRSAASRGSGEPGQLRPHSRARRGDSAGRLSGMVQDPKRPSSASVYPAGRNTGGNEVGTNRVRGWRLVSAHVTSKMASVQAIARGHRRSGRLGRPPTEPKVRGSNPLGRVSVLACKPVLSRSQRHVAGVERVPHKCPKRLTSALPCPLRPRDLARCRRRPGEPRWPRWHHPRARRSALRSSPRSCPVSLAQLADPRDRRLVVQQDGTGRRTCAAGGKERGRPAASDGRHLAHRDRQPVGTRLNRQPGSPRRCARGVSRSIAGPRARCFRRAAPRPSAHWSCAARDAGRRRARTATRTSCPSCRSRRPPAPGRPVRRPANSRTGSRPRAST